MWTVGEPCVWRQLHRLRINNEQGLTCKHENVAGYAIMMREDVSFKGRSRFQHGWHLVCLSRELKPKGIKSLVFPNGDGVVVFRGEDGAAYALEAYCYHRGANLAQGKVEGSCIICPYHCWVYDGKTGQCVDTALTGAMKRPEMRDLFGFLAISENEAKIPERVRQAKYPVAEQDGLIWVFSDQRAYFPPPKIPGIKPSNYFIYSFPTLFIKSHSTHVVENVVDIQHLIAVHGGHLFGQFEMGEIAPHEFRCWYGVRFRPRHIGERLAFKLLGEVFECESITSGPNNMIFPWRRKGSWFATLLWSMTDCSDGHSCVLKHVVYFKKGTLLPVKLLNWVLGYAWGKMSDRVLKEDAAIFNECNWGVGQLDPKVDYGFSPLWAFLRKFEDPSNFG